MPVIHTVACDICGRWKQETNHWYVGMPRHEAGNLIISRMTPHDLSAENRSYLCGKECAIKWVASRMDELPEVSR